MKKIIVPTDFSDNANNALSYAIQIANECGAQINLIHTYQLSGSTGTLWDSATFLRDNAEKELTKLVDKHKREVQRGAALQAKALRGETIDTICAHARRQKADLIIMGTLGATGLKKVFLGSNAAGVIKKSTIPVLAVPPDYTFKGIKNIMLSVDDKVISSEVILRPLTRLAKIFKAKVEVVHVIKPAKIYGQVDPGIDIYLSDLPHSFELVHSSNVNRGINKQLEYNKADMLCMVQRNHGVFGELFHRSVTQSEVFNCAAPLLIVTDPYVF